MNRRGFVGAMVVTPLLAWTGNLLAKAFQFPAVPQSGGNQFPGGTPPGPPPPGPMQQQGPTLPGSIPLGPTVTPDNDPEMSPPKIDPHMVLVYQQQEIKKSVNDLYDLARKLRNQVLKTDSTEVLSLNMMRTAGKIQNLAKHIQDLARG
jgi:hypothetical protein